MVRVSLPQQTRDTSDTKNQQDVTDAEMKFQEEEEVITQADTFEVLVFLLPLLRNWTLNSELVIDRLQDQGRNSQTAYFSDDRFHRTSKCPHGHVN